MITAIARPFPQEYKVYTLFASLWCKSGTFEDGFGRGAKNADQKTCEDKVLFTVLGHSLSPVFLNLKIDSRQMCLASFINNLGKRRKKEKRATNCDANGPKLT